MLWDGKRSKAHQVAPPRTSNAQAPTMGQDVRRGVLRFAAYKSCATLRGSGAGAAGDSSSKFKSKPAW